MRTETKDWLMPVLLALAAAAALWYFQIRVGDAPSAVNEPAPVAAAPPAAAERPRPVHPLTISKPGGERPELRPLPSLDQSDAYFKLELSDLYGVAVADLLANSRLLERVVATVDNLPRAHIAERIRPAGRLASQFAVGDETADGKFELLADNYHRYDTLINIVTAVDMDRLVDMYRRFYPLLQKAYVDLGYPNGYFNDRLVEVIDHLLETPQPQRPLMLVRPHVLYQFADPDLERRSSGQKLLLRMGEEHATQLKHVLRDLRRRITEQQGRSGTAAESERL